jgi:periplasmic divalent cation tolerance protein
MVEHLLVTATTPDRDTAVRLACSAVSAKLAVVDGTGARPPVACFFWHLGDQGKGEEWIATFNTTCARYWGLEARLIAEHPWKKPEVTAIRLDRARLAPGIHRLPTQLRTGPCSR